MKPHSLKPLIELYDFDGKPKRPLPGFVDAETTLARVPPDVRDWITCRLKETPVPFPWYWFGPVGCGKSSAAALVYQYAPDVVELTTGHIVRTMPLAFRLDDLVGMIRKGRRAGGLEMMDETTGKMFMRTEGHLFSMMRRAAVVVIDEVGNGKPDDKDRLIVDRLSDVLQFCRVIYTSNIYPKRPENKPGAAVLQDIYDARIASRMVANGHCREFSAVRMRNSKAVFEFQNRGQP